MSEHRIERDSMGVERHERLGRVLCRANGTERHRLRKLDRTKPVDGHESQSVDRLREGRRTGKGGIPVWQDDS